MFVPSTLSNMRTVVTGGNSTLCIGSAVIWAEVTLFRCKVFACTGCLQAKRGRERERGNSGGEQRW
jgi:hypothetical protein